MSVHLEIGLENHPTGSRSPPVIPRQCPLLLARRRKSHFCFLSSRPFRSKQASVSCTLLRVVLIDRQFQLALGRIFGSKPCRLTSIAGRPLKQDWWYCVWKGVEAFLPFSSIPYPWGTRHSPPFSGLSYSTYVHLLCFSFFSEEKNPTSPWIFFSSWETIHNFDSMAHFHEFLCVLARLGVIRSLY